LFEILSKTRESKTMKNQNTESLKTIMLHAWKIKREHAGNYFPLCLKMAWENFKQESNKNSMQDFTDYIRKNSTVEVEQKPENLSQAESIIYNWNHLTVDRSKLSELQNKQVDKKLSEGYTLKSLAQSNFIVAEYKTSAKRVIGLEDANTYNQINEKWLWSWIAENEQELTNTCFIEVLNRLNIAYIEKKIAERDAWNENPENEHKYGEYQLKSLVYTACQQGLKKFYRKEIKNVRVKFESADAETQDFVLNSQTDGAEDFTLTVESAELAKDFMQGIIDKTDKMIFACMAQRKTEREIAEIVNLSKTPVHKRIEKIRKNFAEYMNA
jgi:hypothetical protein